MYARRLYLRARTAAAQLFPLAARSSARARAVLTSGSPRGAADCGDGQDEAGCDFDCVDEATGVAGWTCDDAAATCVAGGQVSDGFAAAVGSLLITPPRRAHRCATALPTAHRGTTACV